VEIRKDLPVVLTVREAAAIARVNQDTIRRWITSKQLEATRVGPAGNLKIESAALLRAIIAGAR
jgi:excisionase family DNA binding protein